jgi:uncharacterized membrane protein YgcG
MEERRKKHTPVIHDRRAKIHNYEFFESRHDEENDDGALDAILASETIAIAASLFTGDSSPNIDSSPSTPDFGGFGGGESGGGGSSSSW